MDSKLEREKSLGGVSGLGGNLGEIFSIESSVEQKAMSNSLIMRKVMEYSKPQDVLNFRLISKAFEEEATCFILVDPKLSLNFQVEFCWSGSKSEYEHVYLGTLQEFSEDCLGKSRKFPVWNFYFKAGDLGSSSCSKFFIKHGQNIKSLVIDPTTTTTTTDDNADQQRTSPQTLRSILFDWLPNLKHLTFVSTPWSFESSLLEPVPESESESESEPEIEPEVEPEVEKSAAKVEILEEGKTVLPSLESLTLKGNDTICSTGIIQDILNSAPNLKLVKDAQLKYTELLVSTGKFNLSSKSMCWKFDRNDNERFLCYASAGPRVTDIELDSSYVYFNEESRPQAVRGVNALFNSSQSTAERLKIPFLQFLPSIQLPKMPQVRCVRFHKKSSFATRGREKFLPDGAILKECFPSLETLGFYNLRNDHPEANPLFSLENFHDQVRTLEVTADFPHAIVEPVWIEKIHCNFPNMTTLVVELQGLELLPGVTKAVWKWLPRLESLNLQLTFPINKIGQQLPGEVDSAILGIPLENCKQLRRNFRALVDHENQEIQLGDVEALRENPSIFNLKKLKTFTMEFPPALNTFIGMFTPLSVLCGFLPMRERQGTRVVIKAPSGLLYAVVKGVCGVKPGNNQLLIVE